MPFSFYIDTFLYLCHVSSVQWHCDVCAVYLISPVSLSAKTFLPSPESESCRFFSCRFGLPLVMSEHYRQGNW